MEYPLVTVLMPVYNCELYISDAVKSILNQTYTNFEFLIIDDASTDQTTILIKEIEDPRIKLIEKSNNSGYTQSLNYGLSIAKGDYIARMDGDDIADQERLAKQVDFLESYPDVVVCGTNFKFIGTNKVKVMPESHEDIKTVLLQQTCFAHPTVMLRKAVLDRHNIHYDLSSEPAEDYELWVRLLNFGKLHNIQEVLLHYRIHDEQVSVIRRSTQLKSKLNTRLKVLRYVDTDFSVAEEEVLKMALTKKTDSAESLANFIDVKNRLLLKNETQNFFDPKAFGNYFNELERDMVVNYFLKQDYFYPKLYWDYMKLKKRLDFKLPLKTEFIIFIKSMLCLKNKTSGNESE